jgi:hypothetical protein
MVPSSGAAESAAVDPELAIVVSAWTNLTGKEKEKIMGIVKRSKSRDS